MLWSLCSSRNWSPVREQQEAVKGCRDQWVVRIPCKHPCDIKAMPDEPEVAEEAPLQVNFPRMLQPLKENA